MNKLFFVILSTLCISMSASAQSEIVDNKKIIDLTAAKLGDDIVINVIKTSNSNFDLTTSGLIDLSKNGVSQAVIKEMMAKKTAVPVALPVAAIVPAAPDVQIPRIGGTPISKEEKIKLAMKNIRVKADDMNRYTAYLSDRTPRDNNDGDRMYVYMLQMPKVVLPKMEIMILHNAQPNSQGEYFRAEKVYINADGVVREFLAINGTTMYGNGTQHSTFKVGLANDNEKDRQFLRKIGEANNASVKFVGGGNELNISISGREKKAINDVLDLYYATVN